MPEEETPEQGGDDVPKEGVSEDVEVGTETPSAIEVAQKLHDQIKSENDRHEALVVRQEKLAAQNMLGGSSNAGQAPPEKKEMTDEEYAEKVMAGETPEK